MESSSLKQLKSIATASAAKISATTLGLNGSNLPLPPPKAVPLDPNSIKSDMGPPKKRPRQISLQAEEAATDEWVKNEVARFEASTDHEGRELISTFMVPHELAGLIIGKGGTGIKAIEAECGVVVRITADDGSTEPGMRQCVVVGGDPKKQERAKAIVDRIVEMGKVKCTDPNALVVDEMQVPEKFMGSVIGANGAFLKRVKETTGCRTQVDKETPRGEGEYRTLQLSGSFRAVQMGREQFELQILEQYRRLKIFNAELERKFQDFPSATPPATPPPPPPGPPPLHVAALPHDAHHGHSQVRPPPPPPLPPPEGGACNPQPELPATIVAPQHQEAMNSLGDMAVHGHLATQWGSYANTQAYAQVPMAYSGLQNELSPEYYEALMQWAAFYARDSACVSYYMSLRSSAAKAYCGILGGA